MSELLRAQLYALRAQLDAVILGVEAQAPAATPPIVPGACPKCGAPEDKQADASTLASPGLKHCLVCDAEYV